MTKRTLILSTTLIGALIFSAWLIHKTTSEPSTLAQNLPDRPDAFMINATYLGMDENGNLHNQIYLPKMTHYIKNNTSEFTDPQIIIYGKNHEPWLITAKFGQSKFGVEEVQLWKNVKIHQPAGPKNRELTITTSSLTFFPKHQSASTDEAITIAQPGAVVNSVGLRANLNKGEVQLLSRAKGVYEASATN
jgi:lipopolysaccharide export system protein LptC